MGHRPWCWWIGWTLRVGHPAAYASNALLITMAARTPPRALTINNNVTYSFNPRPFNHFDEFIMCQASFWVLEILQGRKW